VFARVSAIYFTRVNPASYNHYSLLKSLEDIFQTKEYLGYADDKNLVPFGSDIFTSLK
jgi:hypothetical protein